MRCFEWCFSNLCLYFLVKQCQVITIQTFSLQEMFKWTLRDKGFTLKNWQLLLPYNGKTSFGKCTSLSGLSSYKNENKTKEIQYTAESSCSDLSNITGYRNANFTAWIKRNVKTNNMCSNMFANRQRHKMFCLYSLCNFYQASHVPACFKYC